MHKNFKDRTGEKFLTEEGYEIEIIEYFGWDNCTIKFNDENGTILYNHTYNNLTKLATQNPYHPTLCGVGYLGIGKYELRSFGEKSNAYKRWSGMIKRVYSGNSLSKRPTYRCISVCSEWHNFQNFAEWYNENWKSYMDETWDLDKDILTKANKTYCAENCCFVPQEINNVILRNSKTRGDLPIGVHFEEKSKKYRSGFNLSGKRKNIGRFTTVEDAFFAYKIAKEDYIKEIADKWKGLITERVYQALINYKVEITD